MARPSGTSSGALALALLPAQARAASPAYGSDVWLRDTALQDGVTYSENIFWSSGYEKPRHEYVFTYTPGVGAAPGEDLAVGDQDAQGIAGGGVIEVAVDAAYHAVAHALIFFGGIGDGAWPP